MDSSFRAVIAGSTAVVLLIVALLAWLLAVSVPAVQRYEDGLEALQAGHTAMLDQETSLRGFLSTSDLAFMQPYAKAKGELYTANDRLALLDGDRDLAVAVMNMRLAQQRWVSEWALVAAGGNAPGAPGSEAWISFMLRGKVLFDTYGDARVVAEGELRGALAEQRRHQSIAFSVAAGLGGLIGLSTLAAAIVRRRRLRRDVLTPVTAVLAGLETVRRGDVGVVVETAGPRELVDVVDGFNRMTVGLAEARERAAARERHISAQSEKLHRILAMVRDIGGSLKLAYVVDAVVQGVTGIVPADEVQIWLADTDAGTLTLAGDAATGTEPVAPVELGAGPVGRAAKYSRVVHEHSGRAPAGTPDRASGSQRLAVPLVVGSRVVGVLHLRLPGDVLVEDEQLEVLETLCVHAATALEAARLHEGAAYASDHDALTRLPNRRRLDGDLQVECERSARYDRPLCFVMLDLDHFKRVNDLHGHARGDEVLQGVADVITSTLRASDTAYRYGGEELAVVLRESDLAAGRVLAERLRERIRATFAESDLTVTASFGVAEVREGTALPAQLVAAADAALYRAKAAGRDRVCVDGAETRAGATRGVTTGDPVTGVTSALP
ncbi:MAG TPA: diguanylate cyclase [Actinomycetales bacterium]|nr:diguanylate cyclase [Actinomycetales bacterium]